MEGIALFFRVLYVLLMTGTIIFIFVFSSKSYLLIFSLIFFYLSCPFNMMSLSYNTLSVVFILLVSFILYTFNSKIAFFISGFLFSLSVLCIPYLVFFYIGLFIYCVWVYIFRRNKSIIKFLVYFTLGVSIVP